MYRVSPCSRLLKLTAATIFVAGLTAAQALPPAGPNRPATVPADYVITPFGYFHASCVAHLAQGDVVRQDENAIRHADGSSEAMSACAFPHYDAAGVKVTLDTPGVKAPSISHAWLEYASVTTTSSYGELSANWIVPPAPTGNDGQTVYLFPGMEDYQDVVTIIQPVLGWNSDFASAWGIASWNCCVTGTVYESNPVKVNAGDNIFGEMIDTCATGTLSCPTWDVVTEDVTSGASTKLTHTSSQGQTFNWAFAGALEVYNIAHCRDFPPSNSASFYNLALYNDSFAKIASPGWTVTKLSTGVNPQCSYGGTTPEQLTLAF
jgi:hypothetical protein